MKKDNRGGARENAGRKTIIDGIAKTKIATAEEWKEIEKLLKEIRNKK